MAIHRFEVYKSPNIGLFARANDRFMLLPHGFADTKTSKLLECLELKEYVFTSIAGTRLIGPMAVLNNKGLLLPSIASDEEVFNLKKVTGLNVEKLKSKLTAVGNLICANDRGAIISPSLESSLHSQIQDIFDVEVASTSIGGFSQVGSLLVATNIGGAIHPSASEEEINIVSQVLHVDIEPLTINAGVPYLSSGIIANSTNVIVGNLTSGPELIMLSRAFQT